MRANPQYMLDGIVKLFISELNSTVTRRHIVGAFESVMEYYSADDRKLEYVDITTDEQVEKGVVALSCRVAEDKSVLYTVETEPC